MPAWAGINSTAMAQIAIATRASAVKLKDPDSRFSRLLILGPLSVLGPAEIACPMETTLGFRSAALAVERHWGFVPHVTFRPAARPTSRRFCAKRTYGRPRQRPCCGGRAGSYQCAGRRLWTLICLASTEM